MTVTADQFRDVIGRFATGVTVITTHDDGLSYGTTASAVSSVSLDPPTVLVCLNETSETGRAVLRTGCFAVNILDEDQPELAARFATKGERKFDGVALHNGPGQVPLLKGALATVECRVRETARGGTHTILIADVVEALGRPGSPLTYYRGQFGRFSVEQDRMAYSELRARILRGELETGEPLDLAPLAEQLGVPRAAVYHALSELSGEGLVKRTAAGSYLVPPATSDAVLDALPALFGLWLGTLLLTEDQVSDGELAELEEHVSAMCPPDDVEQLWTHADFERARKAFFGALGAIAGSAALHDAFTRADLGVNLLLRGAHGADLDRAVYLGIHRHYVEVLSAYRARDSDAILGAMRDFVAFARELIESALPR